MKKQAAGIILCTALTMSSLAGCVPQATNTPETTAQSAESAAAPVFQKEGLPIVDQPVNY